MFKIIKFNFLLKIINCDDFLQLNDILSINFNLNIPKIKIEEKIINYIIEESSLVFTDQQKNILELFFINLIQYILLSVILLLYYNVITFIIAYLLLYIIIIYNFFTLFFAKNIYKSYFIISILSLSLIFISMIIYNQIFFIISILFFHIIYLLQLFFIINILFNFWQNQSYTNFLNS